MAYKHTHEICLISSSPASKHKFLDLVAEYDPQRPHSIIKKCHADALHAAIELIPCASETFRDRHSVLYIPLGTTHLRWYQRSKPVTTRFYIVNALGPQHAAGGIDIVLGGATEDPNGVIANLFDESELVAPIFPTRLSKEQKERQERQRETKEREREEAVKAEEAREQLQREAERAARLRESHQQRQGEPSS